MQPLPLGASAPERSSHYRDVLASIAALLQDEDDFVAAMSTVVCELHHAFAYYDWTGFYRHARPQLLIVGPYQGGHGCLRIPFDRGVCGAAARTRTTQRVADVRQVGDHIACSSTTLSEIVVPVLAPGGHLMAVLDVDSDAPDAFGAVDQSALEELCQRIGQQFGSGHGRHAHQADQNG